MVDLNRLNALGLAALHHPLIYTIVAEHVEFERRMLSLASLVPHPVEVVTEAFKKWSATTPWQWEGAHAYAVEYFRRRGKLPFQIEVALDSQ